MTGLFENEPYEGIKEVLETLSGRGFVLAVATSKPEETAKRDVYKRQDKYLTEMSVGSRSSVKKIIKSGRVYVDGKEVVKPETKIDENASQVMVCLLYTSKAFRECSIRR